MQLTQINLIENITLAAELAIDLDLACLLCGNLEQLIQINRTQGIATALSRTAAMEAQIIRRVKLDLFLVKKAEQHILQ